MCEFFQIDAPNRENNAFDAAAVILIAVGLAHMLVYFFIPYMVEMTIAELLPLEWSRAIKYWILPGAKISELWAMGVLTAVPIYAILAVFWTILVSILLLLGRQLAKGKVWARYVGFAIALWQIWVTFDTNSSIDPVLGALRRALCIFFILLLLFESNKFIHKLIPQLFAGEILVARIMANCMIIAFPLFFVIGFFATKGAGG